MRGSSKDFKSEKIIVKIDNTKTKNYGGSPPRSRKRRYNSSSTSDDSSDDRKFSTYEYGRYRDRTPPRSSRHSKLDKFGRSRDLDRLRHTFKVLCVNTLYPNASNKQIKEVLYQEYRRFGEFSVKISYEKNERLAYMCFERSNDARDALHRKRTINIYGCISLITPVYESSSSRDHYESEARHFQSQNFSTNFERNCPTSTRICGSLPTNRSYEMLSYGALPSMRPPQVFREIHLPPLRHSELIIPQQPLMHHLTPTHLQLGSIRPFYGIPAHLIPPYTPFPHSCLTHDKKDKFPNYLDHIPPEDDPLATRTLFVGNLEINITDEDVKRIFVKYGVIEDIDVKRPLLGTGNSYAFIRYQNLDMAHKAKVELSGKYLGKYECKIGYGKPIQTRRIWIGGLSPRTSITQLEQAFDKYGIIEKIEYKYGDIDAYILFESTDSAIEAVDKMRGVALKGSMYRLRTDFATVYACDSLILTSSSNSKSSLDDSAEDLQELTKQDPIGKPDDDNTFNNLKKSDPNNHHKNSLSFKKHSDSDVSSPRSPLNHSIDIKVKSEKEEIQSICPLDSVVTPENLVLKCTDVFHGSFILRNCHFPTSCYLTFGDMNILKTVIKYKDCESMLKINQRLPLTELVLEDISRPEKITNVRAVFLAMPPCSTNSISNNDASLKFLQFKDLILFLRRKKAAGIGISLTSENLDLTSSVLCVFPPCEYSTKLLKQYAKNLISETLKCEDYLVVIVVNKVFFI